MSILNWEGLFVPSVHHPEERSERSLWFLFDENRILVEESAEAVALPMMSHPADAGFEADRVHYMGMLDDAHCYVGQLTQPSKQFDEMQLIGLRDTFSMLGEPHFALAGRAFQILEWDRNHQFCGRCGSKTLDESHERAKRCEECGLVSYPRLSPAIIVCVRDGDKILLSRAAHFRKNIYSVTAGFVEPGESLEQAVEREVFEEVGLKLDNIRYYGSQPWPFPHSLMIGFLADYQSGEIKVDGDEIVDAMWCTANSLPEIPSEISISRKLIDASLQLAAANGK